MPSNNIAEILERNGLSQVDVTWVKTSLKMPRGEGSGITRFQNVLETVARLLGKCEPFVNLEEFRDVRAILAEVLK